MPQATSFGGNFSRIPGWTLRGNKKSMCHAFKVFIHVGNKITASLSQFCSCARRDLTPMPSPAIHREDHFCIRAAAGPFFDTAHCLLDETIRLRMVRRSHRPAIRRLCTILRTRLNRLCKFSLAFDAAARTIVDPREFLLLCRTSLQPFSEVILNHGHLPASKS